MQTGYGVSESSFLSQMETPLEADPYAKRAFAKMKYLREMWKVSDVSTIVKTIKSSDVWAKQSATMRLLRNAERSLYSGDESMIPEQWDGFEKTIRNNGSANHIRDKRGNSPVQEDFDYLAELITTNYGNANNAGLYCSPGGINTLAQILRSGTVSNTVQRVAQASVGADGNIAIGYGVNRIHTAFGTIIPKNDIFIAGEYESCGVPQVPTAGDPLVLSEGATSVRSPNMPTHAVTIQAPPQNSLWLGTGNRQAGTYRYRVAAGNRFGLSQASAADAGSVVAVDGTLTITITPQGGAFPATFFRIYAEPSAGSGNYYKLIDIAASGSNPVSYVDTNAKIPGTTKMFLLDLTSVGEMRNFALKRLAPYHSKAYSRIGEFAWGTCCLYATPAYYAPLRFAMLDNVGVGVQSKSPLLNV